MNTKSSQLKKVLYILIPVALIAVVVIKLKSNKETAQEKVFHYDKQEAINVTSETLKLESIEGDAYYSGTFEPFKETKISAEVQGKINEIKVDVGSVVKKDQAIIQLDNSLLKLQLKSVDAQIEGLEADVKRYTILVKADAIQGVQLEKTELGLKTAKIQKETLQEQINKTTIRAPFNGIITAKLNEEGGFAAPGIPLLQVTDIEHLKFTANVSESDLDKFKIKSKYSLSLDIYPEIKLTGETIMVGSKANMGSSFPVQLLVSNTSDLKIKSGMFGKVNLQNNSTEKGIIIPASAIIGDANQPQVYIAKNNKAQIQNVVISKRIKNKCVITKGLNEGDVVITSGFINLFDSANILIKN